MDGDVVLYEKLVGGGSIKALKRAKNGSDSWTYLLITDERDAVFDDDDRALEELYSEKSFPNEEALIEAYMKATRG
ncbi:MAG: hypothetical protein HYR85_04065 [Planctomycetes bacterium]|nr:hypothetical protein [Planctomycetota bacterium]MBI3844866.1 hypothetical protein [Planctomycetota bacterium]